jgi:very-short-patch-repair endonuclease
VIESAASLPERNLATSMDFLIQHRRLTLERLQKAIDAYGWFQGRAVLRHLVNDRMNGAGIVRSFLEFDLDKVLKRNQLPLGIRNYKIKLPNGSSRFFDPAWQDLRAAVEAHSWQHHSNTTDWGNTITRDRQLTAFGWTVLPVVVADVRDPTNLIADLRTVLGTGAVLGSVLDCAIRSTS